MAVLRDGGAGVADGSQSDAVPASAAVVPNAAQPEGVAAALGIVGCGAEAPLTPIPFVAGYAAGWFAREPVAG